MAQRGHPKQIISSTTLGHIGYLAPRGFLAMPNSEAGHLRLMGSDLFADGKAVLAFPRLCGITLAYV